jgi:hypothetical protein
MDVTKHEVVYAMQAYGGRFIQNLAGAWLVADPNNRARIEATWSDEWNYYTQTARSLKEVDGDR